LSSIPARLSPEDLGHPEGNHFHRHSSPQNIFVIYCYVFFW